VTTVLIADDQPLIRRAVSEILAESGAIEVLGEATDGAEAVALARRLKPDIVVMDIRMPRLDGIEATRAICADAALTATRVLILTTFDEDEYLVAALRAGASGFVGKGAESEEIVRAVQAVHEGEALLSPIATRNLIDRFLSTETRAPLAAPPELELLTEREYEVFLAIARGHSNQEIAERLFISPLTVKTHAVRAMTKLGARDRTQLVILAYEHGIVIPGA
jgi:DNA-binding NarL/FixJ family response regulator